MILRNTALNYTEILIDNYVNSIIILAWFLWSITEILVGVIYQNELNCYYEMTIDTWFYCKAVFSLIAIFFWFLYLRHNVIKVLFVWCNMFVLFWSFAGTIIFFTSCLHKLNTYLSIYIILSLVFGFISVLNLYNVPIRTNEPLLSVN